MHWPLEMSEGPVYVVDTGVPHAVLFVDDLDATDVESLGRKIRFDSRFDLHHGVNVNFVRVDADGKIALRTYERGVGETLACGTGAAAAAFVALRHLKIPTPIATMTRCSFDSQKIQYQQQIRFLFPQNAQGETEIEMLGSAHEVFAGSFSLY